MIDTKTIQTTSLEELQQMTKLIKDEMCRREVANNEVDIWYEAPIFREAGGDEVPSLAILNKGWASKYDTTPLHLVKVERDGCTKGIYHGKLKIGTILHAKGMKGNKWSWKLLYSHYSRIYIVTASGLQQIEEIDALRSLGIL